MTEIGFVDCHNHLYCEEFDIDRDEVINKAKEDGLKGMISVTESADDVQPLIEMVKNYPNYCFAGLGVHPVQKDGDKERSATMEDLEKMLPHLVDHLSEIVCIGEIGLDFTPRVCSSENDKLVQRHVFSEQIKFADQNNLPINVHSRSAGRPVIKLLKEANARNVLLHAFDGKTSVAMEGASHGFFFSFPPSIVRSEQKDKIVRALPLDRILLETDSPALGPEKMIRNEPVNTRISFEYIAQAKKLDHESLANILMENTKKLFPKMSLSSSF